MSSKNYTKIYTKGGDLGQTSLIGGARVSKSDIRLEAYGTVDELNAQLGFCLAQINDAEQIKPLYDTLKIIQNDLFAVGSHLACSDAKLRQSLPPLPEKQISVLESEIDNMTANLPELRDFILPGGHLVASALHVARTVCRRAERNTMALVESNNGLPREISEPIIKYLNRLSDYLFVSSRFVNFKTQMPETKWKKPKE
ncbi:MAG: cob(I)yrinic acid a,c-diamide adenosyltransferase [Bdellovibrionales bacterium]